MKIHKYKSVKLIITLLFFISTVSQTAVTFAETSESNSLEEKVSQEESIDNDESGTKEVTSETESTGMFYSDSTVGESEPNLNQNENASEDNISPTMTDSEELVSLTVDSHNFSSSVISDPGLKAIINFNLKQPATTDITIDMLSKLTLISFDNVKDTVVVNDYSGLEYATKLTRFGSTDQSSKGSNVTLNNLKQFTLIANQLPKLTQVRFGWVNIPDVTPLVDLANVAYLHLKADNGKDFSRLSKLYDNPKFSHLNLTFDSTRHLGVPIQVYDQVSGIIALNPFILPEGQSFDFSKTILATGWTYNNGFFVKSPSPISNGQLQTAIHATGSHLDKLFLGKNAGKSALVDYQYSVTNLTNIDAHDSTINVGDIWLAEDNFDSAIDKNGNPVGFENINVMGTVNTLEAGVYPIEYAYDGVKTIINVTVSPIPEGAPVMVSYQNQLGEDLSSPVTLTGLVGESYKTEAKEIDGYVLKVMPNNSSGKFTETPQEVVYVYTALPDIEVRTVIAKYVDETGKELTGSVLFKGKTGESYETEAKEIDGYVLKVMPNNSSGKFTETPQEVVYVYTALPDIEVRTVIAKYVDETGKELTGSVLFKGKTGESYETEAREIDGYGLKVMPNNSSGKFTETPQEVVYVYTALPDIEVRTVIAKYVDETGKELSGSVLFKGKTGESYETEAKEIDGYGLKVMPNNSSGKFTEIPQEVVYVYREIEIVVIPPIPEQPAAPNLKLPLSPQSEDITTNPTVVFPQTGEKESVVWRRFGEVAIIGVALFYLLKRKNKIKREKQV